MFKGSRNFSECLAPFALPQKRNIYAVGTFLFHYNLLAPYRKIEMLELLTVLFWDSEKD